MSIEIPFECNKTVNDFELTDKGFFCGDCQHHIVDLRNFKGIMPEKGSCVIVEEELFKPSIARKITYRFALTMFLVMGSSIIVNNKLQAHELLNHFDELREKFVNEDTTDIILHGEIADKQGRGVKPVKVMIELPNGEKLESTAYSSRHHGASYYFNIPEKYIKENIKISFEYYDQTKTIDLVVESKHLEAPIQIFERNRKDKFTKKRYPKRLIVGKF